MFYFLNIYEVTSKTLIAEEDISVIRKFSFANKYIVFLVYTSASKVTKNL
jgi:hypothetical protein